MDVQIEPGWKEVLQNEFSKSNRNRVTVKRASSFPDVGMATKVLHSLFLGLIFCGGQSFGESILGFFITVARHSSDINFEGALMFMWIRIAMTIIPYLFVFVIVDLITKDRMRPSFMSLGLNVIILTYFYHTGLIRKDATSFIMVLC